ncbi:MAG: UDP-2,4-diacetamido-2,4,6-trideoxy-beta-L-altropyranose hydrolase [Gammaproteobacteria bacterium]
MTADTLFGPLVIRADASPAAGIGHLMRGLALAQSWQDRGGMVQFVAAEPPPALAARLEREGFPLTVNSATPGGRADAAATLAVAKALDCRWLVVDGYDFGPDYLAALKAGGPSLLVVDDFANSRLGPADLVLNQNLQAQADAYADVDRERLLLGSRYVLLRREFSAIRKSTTVAAPARPHLLLMMGGSDPANVSVRLLEFLRRWEGPKLRITVLTGPANPHRESVQAAVDGVADFHDARLVANPPDLPALLASADLAISAAGTSCWELACLGVPMLLVVVADNQRAGAEAFRAQGIAEVAGWHDTIVPRRFLEQLRRLLSSPDILRRLAAAGGALVDGRGAGRVAERLASYPVTLRLAVATDAELLFSWANDPLTRRMSFHPEAIAWTDHVAWLETQLRNPDCKVQIGREIGASDIGQLRLDRKGEVATLSVGLASAARGRGLAARLIRRAAVESLEAGWCVRVDARVRPENEASLVSFRRAGFREQSPPEDSSGAATADAKFFSFP